MASTLDTLSVRDMLETLIAGQRNPRVLADLVRGRMKLKHDALVEALTGQFDDHHAELVRMLLDDIDRLTTQIDTLITAIPVAQGVDADGTIGPHAGTGSDAAIVPAATRLDEITGIGPAAAQTLIAEIGLDMTRFPTAEHLVSWAKLCPRIIQSGSQTRAGKGNPYLKAALGDAAATAARTNTFLDERYRRLVKHRGKKKALVAVARSNLTFVWHLLNEPTTRYQHLGPDYHASRIDTNKKARNHLRQLQALGYTVTVT